MWWAGTDAPALSRMMPGVLTAVVSVLKHGALTAVGLVLRYGLGTGDLTAVGLNLRYGLGHGPEFDAEARCWAEKLSGR